MRYLLQHQRNSTATTKIATATHGHPRGLRSHRPQLATARRPQLAAPPVAVPAQAAGGGDEAGAATSLGDDEVWRTAAAHLSGGLCHVGQALVQHS